MGPENAAVTVAGILERADVVNFRADTCGISRDGLRAAIFRWDR